MIAFLDNKLLVQQIAWMLLHTLWQGVAIAALLAVVLRVLRDAPANVRYVVACTAMTLMLVAAIVTFALLARSARETPPVVRLSQATGVSRTMTTDVIAPSRELAAAPPRHEGDHLRYVVTTWLAGVTAMAVWHVGGWLIVIRLRRGRPIERLNDVLNRLAARVGVTRAVRLVEAARVEVPAVVGVLRPVIVVPLALLNDLAPQHVEAILAHELAHIRRHDYLVNLVQSAVETLMFYHPATWWISATIRRERENCCDDIAAKICGDERAYAAALAALEARRAPALVSHLAPAATGAGGAGAGGELLDRVRRVLKLPPLRRRASRTRSLAAAALAIACVVLPLVVTAQEKPPATKPDAAKVAGDDVKTSPITPEDLAPRDEPVRIGKDDLVVVSLTDLVAPGVETIKTARISETGKIALPRAGEVAVGGLTVDEARDAVAKQYATILRNAEVKLSLQEARGRAFSVLGAVARPGRYQITQDDFRVLDALVVSKGEPASVAELRLIRDADKRVLAIPPARLAAGDAGVNVVIRGGDMLIATPREKRIVKVLVGKDDLRHDGKFIDIETLQKLFAAMGEAERTNTVLEVAAASPDVTVERFFTATAALHRLAEEQKLAYLSQAGIAAAPAPAPAPAPATQPATQPAATRPAQWNLGDAPVNHTGVHALRDRKPALKDDIAAAGGSNPLATTSGGAGPELARLADAVAQSQLQIQQLQKELQSLRAQPPHSLSPLAPPPPWASQAPSLEASLDERRQLERALVEMSSSLGGEHVQIKAIKSALKQLDERIAQERQREAQRRASMPQEEIAAVDATMRECLRTREQMEFNLQRLGRNVGPKNRAYVDAQRDLELQKQRIDTYAETFRRQFSGDMLDTRHSVTPPESPPATRP